MAFDWMHATIPPRPDRSEEQFLRGCRERAQLLRNLHFTEAQAVARIQANLRWEFDVPSTPLPSFFESVPAMVAEVYHRRSSVA